jgi:hypothetical protein
VLGLPVDDAPGLPSKYFVSGNTASLVLDDHGYAARTATGPWVVIPATQVPPPMLAVPELYDKFLSWTGGTSWPAVVDQSSVEGPITASRRCEPPRSTRRSPCKNIGILVKKLGTS